MKVLIARTDGSREVVEVQEGGLLSQAQKVCDGWVDVVNVDSRHLGWLSIFVNDEGLLIGLDVNPFASAITADGQYPQHLVGDVLIAGGVDDDGNTEGLTDFQIEVLLTSQVRNAKTGELV